MASSGLDLPSWSLLIYTDRLSRNGKISISNERNLLISLTSVISFTSLKPRTNDFNLQNKLVYRNNLKPTDFSLLFYLALPSY